ncbi:MAG: AMP-binding enzyme [Geminicoccaceae bacterium]
MKDVAVIGVPDEKWGERVHGFVVLHQDATADEAELIAFAKQWLAGYKRLHSLSVIQKNDMPRNATGKILLPYPARQDHFRERHRWELMERALPYIWRRWKDPSKEDLRCHRQGRG